MVLHVHRPYIFQFDVGNIQWIGVVMPFRMNEKTSGKHTDSRKDAQTTDNTRRRRWPPGI